VVLVVARVTDRSVLLQGNGRQLELVMVGKMGRANE
jgi:hypothetical protein